MYRVDYGVFSLQLSVHVPLHRNRRVVTMDPLNLDNHVDRLDLLISILLLVYECGTYRHSDAAMQLSHPHNPRCYKLPRQGQ